MNSPCFCSCSRQIQEDRDSEHEGQDEPTEHAQHRQEDRPAEPADQTRDGDQTQGTREHQYLHVGSFEWTFHFQHALKWAIVHNGYF